jgi:UDP-glucose 4-epimerase
MKNDLFEKVIVIDNLSKGKLDNISRWLSSKKFKFIQGDLRNLDEAVKAVEGCDIIFHLAANPEVRIGAINTKVDYEQNVLATYNLLEAVRKTKSVKKLIFTSTSTVYGEAEKIPTPEDYAPLKPISLYGASKLACESLISGYSHTFGFNSLIVRIANIVGPRSNHGVVYDFVKKLRSDPRVLEVLGDGKQCKSYLHVSDCVDALLILLDESEDGVAIYNVGSEDRIDVMSIARIIIEEMKLEDVEIRTSGGIEGGRGWKGDIKEMQLDISRIERIGWRPKLNSAEAIRITTKVLVSEYS